MSKVKRRCCFLGCSSNNLTSALYTFPRITKVINDIAHDNEFEVERCQVWVEKSKNVSLLCMPLNTLYGHYYVCKNHFSQDQFCNVSSERLKKDAFPMDNPFCEDTNNEDSDAYHSSEDAYGNRKTFGDLSGTDTEDSQHSKIKWCCVLGCYGSNRNSTMHRFPQVYSKINGVEFVNKEEEKRCKIWLASMANPHLSNVPMKDLCKKYFVCSQHFPQDQLTVNGFKKDTAVPLNFDNEDLSGSSRGHASCVSQKGNQQSLNGSLIDMENIVKLEPLEDQEDSQLSSNGSQDRTEDSFNVEPTGDRLRELLESAASIDHGHPLSKNIVEIGRERMFKLEPTDEEDGDQLSHDFPETELGNTSKLDSLYSDVSQADGSNSYSMAGTDNRQGTGKARLLSEVSAHLTKFLPPRWVCAIVDKKIALGFAAATTPFIIQRSIAFSAAGGVEIFAHNKLLPAYHQLWKSVHTTPLLPDTVELFSLNALSLANAVGSRAICDGVQTHDSAWKNCALGFVDRNQFRESSYSKTFRSSECLYLIDNLDTGRCQKCNIIYKKFDKVLSKRKLSQTDESSPNKKVDVAKTKNSVPQKC